MTISRKILVFI